MQAAEIRGTKYSLLPNLYLPSVLEMHNANSKAAIPRIPLFSRDLLTSTWVPIKSPQSFAQTEQRSLYHTIDSIACICIPKFYRCIIEVN